ncbi:MAG: DNA-3-methyladenine glycosylase [Bryobacteraceae bacterium]
MSQIIETVGACRISFREPVFDTLVRSIVYQQLSGKAAATIFGRLSEAVANSKGELTPRSLLKLKQEEARAVGISQQKYSYLRDLAERTVARQVNFAKLSDLSDDEVIAHLTQVKGVGVWTAHMFLIFALQRPDVLPTGDLGVRTAIKRAWDLEELPTPEAMEAIAAPWRPYRSIASWYLWRNLDGPAEM